MPIVLTCKFKGLLPYHILLPAKSKLQVFLIPQEIYAFEEESVCLTKLESLLMVLFVFGATEVKLESYFSFKGGIVFE